MEKRRKVHTWLCRKRWQTGQTLQTDRANIADRQGKYCRRTGHILQTEKAYIKYCRQTGQILRTDRANIADRQDKYCRQTGQILRTDRANIADRQDIYCRQTGQILQLPTHVAWNTFIRLFTFDLGNYKSQGQGYAQFDCKYLWNGDRSDKRCYANTWSCIWTLDWHIYIRPLPNLKVKIKVKVKVKVMHISIANIYKMVK